MRARLLVAVIVVLLAWVLPVVHAMPIDADGPSGLCDNADFDDLIVSLTSPTAAAATPLLAGVPAACSIAIAAVELSGCDPVRHVVWFSVEDRAPPLA